REAAGDEVGDDAVVDVEALRLVDEAGVVPVQAEPAEVFQELRRGPLGAAGHVGVLDAEQVATAVVSGEQPTEQRRARPPYVEVAGGRGREAGDERSHASRGVYRA